MANQGEVRPGEAGPEEQQPAEPVTLQTQLEEARSLAEEERRRADTYLDLAQRAQADFQNYKRRVEQEREKLVRDANADLLRQILPVLDDLERALAHVPGELAEHSWAQGVQMIGTKLGGILEGQGLERIGTEGEVFDPYVHEAVAYETHPEYQEGQVAAIYRPGYRLHERVLRPAQVTVARTPLSNDEQRPSEAFDGAPGTRG
jgi:molecular chaperone GrpE